MSSQIPFHRKRRAVAKFILWVAYMAIVASILIGTFYVPELWILWAILVLAAAAAWAVIEVHR